MSRRGKRTTVWGQVRPRSGRQPYRLQSFSSGRWQWVGRTQFTTGHGFLRRVIPAARGSKLRIWSPRDRRYSTVVTVT
jgi:hypothetical protein